MFRASSCPSSGATTTAVVASGLPSELGDSSIAVLLVVVGPAGDYFVYAMSFINVCFVSNK
jgi:hypothetical protein